MGEAIAVRVNLQESANEGEKVRIMRNRSTDDLERSKDGLSAYAETFCEEVFLKGKVKARNDMIGNLESIPGDRRDRYLYGPRAGA
jgi:hypothetical protein